MAVYKRFKGRKVTRFDKDYDKATWWVQGMVDGERYHKALKTAKTKADAEVEEDLIVTKMRVGEFAHLKDNTKFSAFTDEVNLPYCKLNNVNYGQKFYEYNSLKSFFKTVPLKSVTPSKIEDYKEWRSAQKVRCQKCLNNKHKSEDVCDPPLISHTTVNRELSTLKKLFNVAIYNRVLKENPMRFVKMLVEPEPRERFLSESEKVALFEQLRENKQLLAIVLIGLTTGWRKGQILSVKKEDLDYANQAVSVIKSKRSPARKIIVSDFVWQIFDYLAVTTKSDYLFFNEKTGKCLGDFKKSWWTALKNACIEDLHFHDVWNTFATEFYELGGREFRVQTALSHSEIKTTRGYTHIKDETLRAQLNKVSERQESFHRYPIFTPTQNQTKKGLAGETRKSFFLFNKLNRGEMI